MRRLPVFRAPRVEDFLGIVVQDLKFAFRSLGRSPGFSLAATLMLGIGISAATVIVSTFNGLVMRGLPVEDPHEIVVLGAELPDLGRIPTLAYPNFLDYREHADVFEDLIAVFPRDVNLIAETAPDRVRLGVVSANFFDMLGVSASVGRVFRASTADSRESQSTLVLEHGYWQRRLEGDPAIVGSTVLVNDHPFTVIGVAAEAFNGTSFLNEVMGWVPVDGFAAIDPDFADLLRSRSSNRFAVFARLAPGVTAEQADGAIDSLVAEVQRQHPDENIGTTLAVVPEREARLGLGGEGEWLSDLGLTFLALAGFVLVIACANVANLLLLRGTKRTSELATRAALGAGRWRVTSQLLTESLVLGCVGGIAGVALAVGSTRALAVMLQQWGGAITFGYDIEPDLRVLLCAAALALLTGALTGALPALRFGKTDLLASLNAAPVTAGAPSRRLRAALVMAQVALSLVLVLGSAAFVRSLWHAQSVPLGLESDGLLMLSVEPGLLDYEVAQARSFYEALDERVTALPGVQAAAFATYVPFGKDLQYLSWRGTGQPDATDEDFEAAILDVVSPEYFGTAGTRIVRGRALETSDGREAAVINETMAEALWPGEDPIDKRMTFRGAPEGFSMRVVGIAENGRYQQLWESPRRIVFLPMALADGHSATLFVRAEGDPLGLVDSIRQAISELDPRMPVFSIQTMNDHLRNSALMSVRLGAFVAIAFGVVGVALSAIGLYAAVAYAVGERRRELGVRSALGAGSRDLIALVLRQVLLLTSGGLIVGTVAATWLGPLISGFLVGVPAIEPASTAVVGVAILLLALVAAALPAWRATRIGPIEAIRRS